MASTIEVVSQREKKSRCLPFPISFPGLLWLRGNYDPSSDLEEMEREKEEISKEKPVSIWQLITSTTYRQQFLVAIMVHLAQQFSGINAVSCLAKLP